MTSPSDSWDNSILESAFSNYSSCVVFSFRFLAVTYILERIYFEGPQQHLYSRYSWWFQFQPNLRKKTIRQIASFPHVRGWKSTFFESTSPQPIEIPFTPHSKLTTSDSTKMGPLLEDKTTVPSRFEAVEDFLGVKSIPKKQGRKRNP